MNTLRTESSSGTMRAMVIRSRGAAEVLELAQVPIPKVLRPDEVLVRVRAASVNPVDTYLRAGKVPLPLKYPWILGGDACGTVEAVGPGVRSFQAGQRVFGMLDYVQRPGCYAELALFRESELALAPEGFSDAQLAALPLVVLTSWKCLVDAGRLAPGGRVLIHGGAGGIGSVATPLAKALGAQEVVVTASASSAAACLQRGANRVLDYRDPSVFERETGRFQVILDAAGGYYLRTRHLLERGGTYACITTLSDTDAYTLPNFLQHLWRLSSARVLEPFGGRRVRAVGVRPHGTRLAEAAELLKAGKLSAPEVEELPLEQAAEAHQRLESRRTRGKLILVPAPRQ